MISFLAGDQWLAQSAGKSMSAVPSLKSVALNTIQPLLLTPTWLPSHHPGKPNRQVLAPVAMRIFSRPSPLPPPNPLHTVFGSGDAGSTQMSWPSTSRPIAWCKPPATPRSRTKLMLRS